MCPNKKRGGSQHVISTTIKIRPTRVPKIPTNFLGVTWKKQNPKTKKCKEIQENPTVDPNDFFLFGGDWYTR